MIVKRRYSRAGCMECKRRKIKCDEVHPTCGNCQRVKFPCVYPAANKAKKVRSSREAKKNNLPTVQEPIKEEDMAKDHLHPHHDGPFNQALLPASSGMPTPSPSVLSSATLQSGNVNRNGLYSSSGTAPPTIPNQYNYSGMSVPSLGEYSGVPQMGQPSFPNHPQGLPHMGQPNQDALDPFSDNTRDDGPLDMLLFENVFDDANTLVNGLASFDVLDGENSLQFSAQNTPEGPNLKPFHSDIILNVAANENHFFNEVELQDFLRYGTDVDQDPERTRFWESIHGQMRDPILREQHKQPTNEELLERVNETYNLSSEELEYFRAISCRELFLFIYPFAPTVKDNEIMHVLLEFLLRFKFLVYALMALGASCLFTITKNPKHDRVQKRCTAACMKLLVQAFSDLSNNENSLRHIEGLILTVLILTTLFSDMSIVDATTVPISWISHLNKARSLLIKYESVKQRAQHNKPDSPAITIAKLWFFEFDWISKLGMPNSQITRSNVRDIHSLINPDIQGPESYTQQQMLRKLGMLIPATSTHSGFNLFLTLTTEATQALFKLLDVIAGINESELKQASPEEVGDLITLVQLVGKQKVIPFLSAESQFIIPRDNPAHPDFDDLSRKIFLPPSAYAKDTDDPNNIKYYSYCDVTQRAHYLVLSLKVFTSPGVLHLPRSHPMIKRLVAQTLKLMFFLKRKSDPCYDRNLVVAELEHYWLSKSLFDFRAIMVQLPFRITVDLTDDEDDFEKLDLFFRGLVKFGGGSGIEAVARARKNKEAARQRKVNGNDIRTSGDMEYLAMLFPVY